MNLENFLLSKKMDAAVKIFRRLTPAQQTNAKIEIERFINACRKLKDEDLIDFRTINEILTDARKDEFIGLDNQRDSESVDYSATVMTDADFNGHRIARRLGVSGSK
jgi:hypothetical protein